MGQREGYFKAIDKGDDIEVIIDDRLDVVQFETGYAVCFKLDQYQAKRLAEFILQKH